MITDAKKLGEIFKARREERRLSLKEIESVTSIRANYLEAIEEGQAQKFLSQIYIYGFIRQYATYLGLDTEKLVRDFPEAFNSPSEKVEFAYGIGTLEKRNTVSGGVRSVPNLLLAASAVAVVLFAWWLAKTLGVL
jgi:cytoskeletal protein RodZ